MYVFFFQAEDGIRGAQESRGLGDVYKRQAPNGIDQAMEPFCLKQLHSLRHCQL